MTNYTHILDLAKEAEPPAEGKVSKIVFEDDRIKAVVRGTLPRAWKKSRSMPATSEIPKKSTRDFTVIG